MEIYGRIRRAVLVEGRSQRSVAREFGLARVTVRKMLGYSIPPGYRRKEPPKRPKLGPWVGVIDAILEEDKTKPAKQRHTAKRIFDRLRAEHAFTGGYTIVKDYVRAATLRRREMFIPLAHAPGTAQADFGEALVIVGGEERKARYLRDRPAALRRLLRDGVSGGDDGSVPGRPRSGLRLLRRRSQHDSVRQHEAGSVTSPWPLRLSPPCRSLFTPARSWSWSSL